jgi:hypothetical protein
MAASTKEKQGKLSMQMREVLSNAYSFVRGRQYTEQMANITYEELLDEAINRIEGTKGRTELRPTLLERITHIKEEVSQAVDTVKKKPPSYWTIENDDRISEEDATNTKE